MVIIMVLAVSSCERQKIVQDEYGIYKTRLKNGLTVIIKENHASSLATIHLRLKAGALDDPPSLEGIANLISEMHTKGTPSRPTPEAFWLVARSYGAMITTVVSQDETLFEMTLPSQHLERGLELQADALLHPKFDPTELSKEAEMMIKRKWGRKEDPVAVVKDSLDSLSRQKEFQTFIHGAEESLRKITRNDVLDFFTKHYTANQMILTVVGNIHAKETLKTIQKYYKYLPTGEALERPPLSADQSAFRFIRKKHDIKNSYLGIRFSMSQIPEEDRWIIEAVSQFLGSGNSPRLRDVLKRQKELVNDLFVETEIDGKDGFMDIISRLDAKNIYAAETAIFAELERLKSNPIPLEEFSKIKKTIWTRYLKEQETTQALSKQLSKFEHRAGYRTFHERLKKISLLDPKAVQEMTKKYFDLKKCSLFEYIAEGETPHPYTPSELLKKLEQNIKVSVKKTEPDTPKDSPIESKPILPLLTRQKSLSEDISLRQYQLSNNAVLFLKEEHSLPIASVALLFKGGRIVEETSNSGITQLLLRASLKGTTTQNEFEINRAFDEIGADVETVCEPDFFGYLLTLPKESMDEGLRILSDIVLHPSFQIPMLNREKQNLLSEIDEVEDHPFLYASLLLYEAALKNHPYSLPKLGHRWAILKITPDQLIKWHHQMIQSSGMVLSAVGDFISLDIRTSMENHFKAIKSTPLKYEEIEEMKPPTFISENFRERTRSLTSMAIGFQTSRLNDLDETALKLLETLTRDQGGRFGLRLRTQEKMSDQIVCEFRRYLKGGIFTTYTAFVPTHEKNVLRILIEEFKKLKNHLIDKSEFRAAQAVLRTTLLDHLQTSRNKALEYAQTEIYGKPLTAIDEFLERIDGLTLGEINDTAEKYFDLEKYTLGTVRGIETKKVMPKSQ